jgi:oxygen-independent coproporphyrinogen-3 oxidase
LSGLYVHFPYCAHHCSYCDFTVATPRRIPEGRYTGALLAELGLRLPDFEGPVGTLYVGGGTPSLWGLAELGRFLDAVARAPGIRAGAEITLEANPSEVAPGWLAELASLGVTRVSVGVQSFQDADLVRLERTHDAACARRALDAVAQAGLGSWSLDLMLGLEAQGLEAWHRTLEAALGFDPPHLSVYALTVESRTPLARAVERGRVRLPGEDAQAEMLLATRRVLTARGYLHYEVSSYARPGHLARHNSAYWDGTPYLGLGAGAHSFLPPRRSMNLPRVARYQAELAAGRLPVAWVETLDPATLGFERLMTGLRRLDIGIDPSAFGGDHYPRALAREIEAGHLETVSGGRVRLTEAGLLVMNRVLLGLMPEPAWA